MQTAKEFEILIGYKSYHGLYSFVDNKLFIEEMNRTTCDDRNIESTVEVDSLNDDKEFLKVYELLEKETSDELPTEAEYQSELRYSIAEEKADSIRKYK